MKKLDQQDRLRIFELRAKWYNGREIADIMKRHPSTISREIVRNSNGDYDPLRAQKSATERRKWANTMNAILVRNQEVYSEIIGLLKSKAIDRSPDAIVGRKQKEGIKTICTKTIYNYIKIHEPHLKKYLKYKRWYRRKWIGINTWKLDWTIDSIDNRPALVETRKRIGDREWDTVVNTGRKWWLVTFVERKTRYLLMRKIDDFKANTVHEATLQAFKNHHDKIMTITIDNGKEFADVDLTGIYLWARYYRAHPYQAWNRWTNENTNGMIRKHLPKKKDFYHFSDQKINHIKHRINKKPRRILKYASPYELFHNVKLSYFRQNCD